MQATKNVVAVRCQAGSMVCLAVPGLGIGHEMAVAVFRSAQKLSLGPQALPGVCREFEHDHRLCDGTVGVATGCCALALDFTQFR